MSDIGRIAHPVNGLSGHIRSIQRGTIRYEGTSATATITSVRPAQTIVDWLGHDDESFSLYGHLQELDLQNATTVRAQSITGNGFQTTSFQAVERWP